MALSTRKIGNTSSVIDRRTKLAALKTRHKSLFEKEGVEYDTAKFIPKMAYVPKGENEPMIGLFPSELRGGVDIYVEFTSRDWQPEDPQRRLWKLTYNPHYATEYKSDNSKPNQDPIYLIPIDELIDVASLYMEKETPPVKEEVVQEKLDFDELPDADEDSPMDTMTIRDHCAIKWKLPVASKKWLNTLIKETFNNNK